MKLSNQIHNGYEEMHIKHILMTKNTENIIMAKQNVHGKTSIFKNKNTKGDINGNVY